MTNANNIITGIDTNVPCKGSGIGLGLTDGKYNFSLVTGGAYPYTGLMMQSSNNAYGTNVGASSNPNGINGAITIGLTTDSTKSGIFGTITRSILTCKIVIKY